MNLFGAPAPRDLATPHELAHEYPNLVRLHELGHEPDHGPISHWTIFRGQPSMMTAPSQGSTPRQIVCYKRSSVIGRQSSIIGPENTLVAEWGYCYTDNYRVRPLPMGRFNPLYWRYMWQGDLRNRHQLPSASRISGSAVVLNNPWCHNFYHWLLEVVPRIMLMRWVGIQPDWYVVDCQGGYQRRALELLGIAPQNCIQPHYGLHLKADLLVRPGVPGVGDWSDMAKTIVQGLPATAGSSIPSPPRIYISRKAASHRKLANENELRKFLANRGFATYSFENIDFAQQVRLIGSAEVIVAVHGAALANLIFAKPGTSVLEICPINRYNPDCFPRVSQKMGLHHATVMAASTQFRQNLHVNLNDVEAAFERLQLGQLERRSSSNCRVA